MTIYQDFEPLPTLRESLRRGKEMPAWLIEMISERHDVGELFPDCCVIDLFAWDSDFWPKVQLWQDSKGELPENK